MSKNKYKETENFFKSPLTLTFRQRLWDIWHQLCHEVLTTWEFWKNKLIYVLIGVAFGWIIGLPMGVWVENKNNHFWESVILEPNRIERVEKLTKQNEAMVDRLIELQQALYDYWMPQSSPDIERPSREE